MLITLPRENSNGHPITEHSFLYLRSGGEIDIVDATGIPLVRIQRVEEGGTTVLQVSMRVSDRALAMTREYQPLQIGQNQFLATVPYDGGEETFENLPERLLRLWAGTKIDKRNCEWIEGRKPRIGMSLCGVLDLTNRVFQTGGPISSFRFEDTFSLSHDAWLQVHNRCQHLEIVDNYVRRFFSIDIETAKREGKVYLVHGVNTWAIPIRCWVETNLEEL
jgi:hypothetical protein